jgi:hypothetical protein
VKNFPHQWSDIQKLRGALEVIDALLRAGLDVGDNEVLGYELANRGVYEFRGLNSPTAAQLQQRIAAERLKESGDQGPRTAAREARRTLRDLGFLEPGPGWSLTPIGQRLLASTPNSQGEHAIWQWALMDLTVSDAGGTSHAGQILLRLVSEYGPHLGPRRKGMELALEARDDTESEFRQIAAFLQLDFDERLSALGITEYKADNAVKIIPAIAEQAGLIEVDANSGDWVLTPVGESALYLAGIQAPHAPRQSVAPAAARPRAQRGTRRRQPSTANTATRRAWRMRSVTAATAATPIEVNPSGWKPVDPDEQVHAIHARAGRTNRHNTIVSGLAEMLGSGNAELYAGQADLVAVPTDTDLEVFLFEIKTLDEGDARTQVLKSASQLSFYRFRFQKEFPFSDRAVSMIAIFESPIADLLAEYLDSVGIAAYVWGDQTLNPINTMAQELLPFIDRIRFADS